MFFLKKTKKVKKKKILLKYSDKIDAIFIPKNCYYKFECISKKINNCQHY